MSIDKLRINIEKYFNENLNNPFPRSKLSVIVFKSNLKPKYLDLSGFKNETNLHEVVFLASRLHHLGQPYLF